MSKFIPYAFLFLLGCLAVSILPFRLDSPESGLTRSVLQDLSSISPAGGRLFDAPSIKGAARGTASVPIGVELALLRSKDAQHLQGVLDMHHGDWNAAEAALITASRQHPGDARILNDLGVAFLAEGRERAAQYLKAIQVFESARRANPSASAPRFNLVLAYQYVGLERLAHEAQVQYERIEKDPLWLHRLDPEAAPSNDSRLVTELLGLLAAHDENAAASLFATHVETYRRLATAEALSPAAGATASSLLRFAAKRLVIDHQDATLAAMLAPMDGPFRDRVIQARRLVAGGRTLYFQNKYGESLHQYDLAESEIAAVPSEFDHLWIELHRANTELRGKASSGFESAAIRLDRIIVQADKDHLRWLKGQVLTAKANPFLTPSYGQITQELMEAIDLLRDIGASGDSVRAVNFLAGIYNSANDYERSFQYVQQARMLTQKDDHVRLTQLFVIAGSAAFHLGCTTCAIAFSEQAVEEARATKSAERILSAQANLATVLEAGNQRERARKDLVGIRSAVKELPDSEDKVLLGLPMNFLCSRIETAAGNVASAERCLQENSELLGQLPFSSPDYSSENFLQMARIYQQTGRVEQARTAFEEAARIVETNDAYFEKTELRSSFENQRRSLYDAAIQFEADHGGLDAAWSYLQRYRSKLFLEFLGQLNPKIGQVHDEVMQRSQVQKRISPDVQVVEYVMLPDRLLIWLVTDNGFQSQTVLVPRIELQAAVASFLEGTERQEDIQPQAERLYRLLIAPIQSKLDPHRAIAIIPDQDLHRLPFPALRNASSHRYLIEDFTLLESPSLTQLLASGGISRKTDSVAFGSLTDDLSTSGELSALKTLYPRNEIFAGLAATRREFLNAMQDADVFHYSGHSVDALDPLRSSVLLDGDHEGPNSITALDISQQHMRPNALVVLASCDSSVGNSRDGVGMRGLTSAFLIGGAGSVVGSLWRVETVSTSRLVTSFHQGYAAGRSAADALRDAQIAFIRSGGPSAHPYYWSGFVVTGNLSALR